MYSQTKPMPPNKTKSKKKQGMKDSHVDLPSPPFRIMSARLKLLLKLGGLTGRPVLATEPLIQHLQAGLRLVIWDHVSGLVESQEGEVSRRLDLTNLLVTKHVWSKLLTVESALALPLKFISPGLVSKPVADEVGITSINQDGNLLEDIRHELVEWKHPVAIEQEIPVDIKVAAIKAVDLSAQSTHNFLLVHEALDVAHLTVAKI